MCACRYDKIVNCHHTSTVTECCIPPLVRQTTDNNRDAAGRRSIVNDKSKVTENLHLIFIVEELFLVVEQHTAVCH